MTVTYRGREGCTDERCARHATPRPGRCFGWHCTRCDEPRAGCCCGLAKPIPAVDQVQVIHVRGMHERSAGDGGPSTAFLSALDQWQILPWRLPYPHDSGEQVEFAESVAVVSACVVDRVLAARRRVVLSGYSVGAYIAAGVAADIAAGRVEGIDSDKILACVLLGDPLRPEHAGAPGIPTPPGYGIAGQRDIPGVTTYWGSAPRDPVAALPAGCALRGLVDLPMMFGSRDWGWARDLAQTLIARQQQPWWRHPFRPPVQWGESIAALNGIAWQGWHTSDYIRDGICTALAALVNKTVSDDAVRK